MLARWHSAACHKCMVQLIYYIHIYYTIRYVNAVDAESGKKSKTNLNSTKAYNARFTIITITISTSQPISITTSTTPLANTRCIYCMTIYLYLNLKINLMSVLLIVIITMCKSTCNGLRALPACLLAS